MSNRLVIDYWELKRIRKRSFLVFVCNRVILGTMIIMDFGPRERRIFKRVIQCMQSPGSELPYPLPLYMMKRCGCGRGGPDSRLTFPSHQTYPVLGNNTTATTSIVTIFRNQFSACNLPLELSFHFYYDQFHSRFIGLHSEREL